MWVFKKHDLVNLLLKIRKKSKNNSEEVQQKYSYIWDYDEPEEIILKIIKEGKQAGEKELYYSSKKEKYILELLSVEQLDKNAQRLIQDVENLKVNTKELLEISKKDKNIINSLRSEIDNLNLKLIEDANKYKTEVINIQSKAQEMVNAHKKKTSEHQENQISEIKKYALQSFVEDLLQPLNNFELAIKAAKKGDNPILNNFIVGFEMLYNQIYNKFIDIGLSKIEPKVGDIFDADIHQIYDLVASDMPKDTILEVKNTGYRLHDRVIKPALVIVSK
ncbi:nucleotide exchange factor GrpE [Metamycoplasma phocicerebrale]|uniref:Protein GrpE n=1 Tax=Metamycoplasma phocicerebrale TaxID=142649 RepID=A0A3Q9V3F8_9BACT|nr:nucleotide exchange factor GrpE [Metamycoplasma phocicerebrale]AZZ65724.1 nucleotide exchange factor GrpE [Metamycoplasma phocicerebrale]